ncbi:MAG: hypothetical protein ACR2LT_03395 [Pyrinomonadaceae bacterium]
MSKSKNYNRIVFLTTLSVYLGLVLVGGTAPVLAHSATTKSFDIKNEIEIKDDLDKNPDNKEKKNDSISEDNFPELFLQLLNNIKIEAVNGNIHLPLQSNFHFELDLDYSGKCNTSSTILEPSADKYLADIVYDNFGLKFKPKALELAGSPTTSIKNIKINLQANSADLFLTVSFNKANSAQFAEFLNHKFSASAKTLEAKLLKRVYENTEVSAQNNQVFVITRLPRAAIDEFLADKDAH